MKYIKLIKKIIASVLISNTNSSIYSNDMLNSNYIIALNPLGKNINIIGYIIIIMLIAIVILIGYTMVSNSKNK